MSNPLISIIIPCYNGEQYLEQTLKSVIWQSYKNWECIVIDDGSTDRSSEIIGRYLTHDQRFRYYKKTNGGLASARNYGIDLVKGEFIQFLDADDILTDNRLERCIIHFDSNPDCIVAYSDYTLFTKHMGFFKILPGKIPGEDQTKSFLFEFNRTFIVPIHAYLFRAAAVKDNKFDETLHSFAEDNEYRIRLSLQGIYFQFIDEILVIYRMNELQVTSHEETKIFQNMLQELKKYTLNPRCAKYSILFEEQFVYLHQRIAISLFMKREFKKGLSELRLVIDKLSVMQICKVLVWGFLMLFLTKDSIANIRSWISTTFNVKVGGWKVISSWKAPSSIIDLLASKK